MAARSEWAPRLECRIVLTYWPGTGKFDMGMFDPLNVRYEPLGTHPLRDIDRIVGDLATRIERERHLLTFSEVTGPR